MKIAVICPYRPGDKMEFLDQFKKYMLSQTLQPNEVFYINHEPLNNEIDIMQRYRVGYKLAAGFDCVLFMEFDDYYSPTYIETMVSEWKKANQPNIISIRDSIYYHISGRYFIIPRSSANTFLLKTGLDIKWPSDNFPYIDVALMEQFRVKKFLSREVICIGIKHGIGMVGGGAHNSDSKHYNVIDEDGSWLRGIVGEENWEFYHHLKHTYNLC